MEDGQEMLTVREMAEIVRIGRDAAYALVASGKVPSVKIGKQYSAPALPR